MNRVDHKGEDNGRESVARIRAHLGSRSIVMVGLMGCGKTSVGRRLAARLGLPFVDADEEIEKAASMSIPEIFASHGEPYFREGERKVIARLLSGDPIVLATGGGAFMNAETRECVRERGVSVWLDADLEVLMRRVSRRDNRRAVMRSLMNERYPVYATADVHVVSREVAHEVIVEEIMAALLARSVETTGSGAHDHASEGKQ